MYKDRIKAEFILEMIERIEFIVKRHKGVVSCLNDIEGQMAVFMAIAQIGETLQKIDDKILEKYDLLEDKKGAYYTRNYIVHDYEGVNLAYIEKIVKEFLPNLKSKMIDIVNSLELKEQNE
jgi:uncharacterized protein with HEPN domain